MRIGALLRRTSMDDLDRWYELTGRALHEDGNRPHEPAVARALVGNSGSIRRSSTTRWPTRPRTTRCAPNTIV